MKKIPVSSYYVDDISNIFKRRVRRFEISRAFRDTRTVTGSLSNLYEKFKSDNDDLRGGYFSIIFFFFCAVDTPGERIYIIIISPRRRPSRHVSPAGAISVARPSGRSGVGGKRSAAAGRPAKEPPGNGYGARRHRPRARALPPPVAIRRVAR